MQSTETILTILVTVIGVFALLQLVILFAMYLALRKGVHAVGAQAAEMKAKVYPILDQTSDVLNTTKELIQRIEPKLEAAAGDLAEMTRTATVEAKNFKVSADEMNERFRHQMARIDGITTSALNGVIRLGDFVNQAANLPVRQITGVMAAARAVVQTLRAPGPRRPAPPATTPFTPREERIRQERSAAVR